MSRNFKFLNPEEVCSSSFAAVDWQGIRSAIDGGILICTRIHAMNVSALGMNCAGAREATQNMESCKQRLNKQLIDL